ncbi:MAG TPA: phage tail protein [Acidimicrobiales bacterium]|jgi:phage tail-like protein|nr:phage tail protein [Acidimicrobiales bacterium]
MTDLSSDFSGIVPVTPMFLFEVDGVQIGVFQEVSGLELTVAVKEYEEGGENGFVHKFPGRSSWPNVVMKAGITNSDALFQWVSKSSGDGFAAAGNKITRCTGAITALGTDGTRLRSWDIQGAFPVRWSGPRFNAGSTEALQEELEIAHHGFASNTFSST